MAVSEQFSDQIRKIQRGRSPQVVESLITKERSQKLDLLIHLITNLRQCLIICGPEGIGKTTLLNIFKLRMENTWPIIYIKANESLSFEKIQELVLSGITDNSAANVPQSLNTVLRGLDKLNRRVVLVCDDAGLLLPGLITSLTQYAAAYGCLRVVFALSDDEIVSKSLNDPALNSCHFIEIPALSETQSGEYLQQLSSVFENDITENDLNPSPLEGKSDQKINALKTEQLFRKTHGIPGKLAEALPDLEAAGSVSGFNKFKALAAACILLLFGGFISHRATAPENEQLVKDSPQAGLSQQQSSKVGITTKPLSLSVPVNVAINTPVPTPKPEVLPNTETYRGYGRTQEADALEEFPIAKQQAVVNDFAVADQVKVEIMPAEPEEQVEPNIVNAETAEPAPEQTDRLEVRRKLAEHEIAAALALKQSEQNKKKAKINQTQHEKELRAQLEAVRQSKALALAAKSKLEHKDKESSKNAEALNILQGELTVNPDALADDAVIRDNANLRAKVKKQIAADAELVEALEAKVLAKRAKNTDMEKELAESIEATKGQVIIAMKPTEVRQKSESAKVKPTVTEDKKVLDANRVESAAVVEKFKIASAKVSKFVAEMEASSPTTTEKAGKGHYTLQVVTFSQSGLLENFMRKHSALGGSLRSVKTSKDGVDRYVVLYGSFDSNTQANAAKQKLPADFSQAMARKM